MEERTSATWITACPDPESWTRYLMQRVVVTEQDCWQWSARLDRYGYGRFKFRAPHGWRSTSAHRAAWLAMRGPIPLPLVPDHLCRNRACINPAHMELVTTRENTQRARLAGRVGRRPGDPETFACHTHGRTNGYLHTMKNGRPRWVCRTCAKDRRDRWRRRS